VATRAVVRAKISHAGRVVAVAAARDGRLIFRTHRRLRGRFVHTLVRIRGDGTVATTRATVTLR
jgi:hypothetical protein